MTSEPWKHDAISVQRLRDAGPAAKLEKEGNLAEKQGTKSKSENESESESEGHAVEKMVEVSKALTVDAKASR